MCLLPHFLRENASLQIRYNVIMLFSDLATYFEKIEATTKRLEKTVILAEILKKCEAEETLAIINLSLGQLRPQYDRLEFNLAEKMIVRAIGVAVNQLGNEVAKGYKEGGDLGELAYKLVLQPACAGRYSRVPVFQSVMNVYEKLVEIAQMKGSGSQERKINGLAQLIKGSDALSGKYIVRMVAGKLRLGFSDKTIMDAISYYVSGDKRYSDTLDQCFQRRPDIALLAREVVEKGVERATTEVNVQIGIPIVPALAQRLKTAAEMIEKMGRVYVEKKWDGTRVQIHFSRRQDERLQMRDERELQVGMFGEIEKPKFIVKSYTRNLDESTAQFPELLNIDGQIKAESVILDGEAVGYDPKTGKDVPFQLTITRKRKHGVAEAQSSVPLRFNIFDLMYLNGKSLLKKPLRERRELLEQIILPGKILVVDPYLETDDPAELREYHKQQLAAGYEGALVKQIDGEYMPGRTGFNWVKFKEAEDSRAKLSDTVDVVIMGYYLGKGKRSDFELGAFLVGIRDRESILTVAKVGTGITDEMFIELGERLNKYAIKSLDYLKYGYDVPKTLEPDVWVEPNVVVEVAADEITASPTHSSGYGLRFPRMVKFRDDKSVAEITTLEELKSIGTMIHD